MTEEDLLYMGFVKGELSLKYHLPRNRFISILSAGTPNEVVFLCSGYADSGGIDDLVCVHNFDYDGYYPEIRLTTLLTTLKGIGSIMNKTFAEEFLSAATLVTDELYYSEDDDGNLQIIQNNSFITMTPKQCLDLRELLSAHLDVLNMRKL